MNRHQLLRLIANLLDDYGSDSIHLDETYEDDEGNFTHIDIATTDKDGDEHYYRLRADAIEDHT